MTINCEGVYHKRKIVIQTQAKKKTELKKTLMNHLKTMKTE